MHQNLRLALAVALIGPVLTLLLSCNDAQSPAQTAPKDGGNEPEWSRHAADVARAYLEKQDGKPLDATFTASKTDDGYMVLVQYITGRNAQGRPIYITGGHCGVIVSKDWKVIKVLPGA